MTLMILVSVQHTSGEDYSTSYRIDRWIDWVDWMKRMESSTCMTWMRVLWKKPAGISSQEGAVTSGLYVV